MAIIKMEDINKTYTEIIGEYISKGYWIYTKTMGGTQGEIAKIDLTNGKHILRIWINDSRDRNVGDRDDWLYVDLIEIIVEEFDDFRDRTLWNKKGKILNTITFYRIGSRNRVYVDDLDICKKCIMMNINRRKARGYSYSNWKKINYNPDTIIKIVKSKRGFKSCKKSDIKMVERCDSMYRIIIDGKRESVCVRFPNK